MIVVVVAVPTFVVIDPQHDPEASPHDAVSFASVQYLVYAFQMVYVYAIVDPRIAAIKMIVFISIGKSV